MKPTLDQWLEAVYVVASTVVWFSAAVVLIATLLTLAVFR